MTHPTLPCEQQLQQLRQDFDEYAYIVSHDLKAPIRAILNLSEWIEEDLGEHVPDEVKQHLQLLRNRSCRLERMMEALLAYSRVGRYDLNITLTDAAHLLQQINPTLEVPVTLRIEGELPVFDTYKAKLQTVFKHLLHNAATYSGKGAATEVRVKAEQLGLHYRFVFSDNGAGVPEHALPNLCTLFYTVAPKDQVNTVGAGLAISKKIIQFVGGSLAVSRNEAGGLAFDFTWPAEPPAPPL